MEPDFESSPECILMSESRNDGFLIQVKSIERVDPPKKIKIKLHLKSSTLDCSPPIDVLETRSTAVNWEFLYKIEQSKGHAVADLAANPLVFSVLKQDLDSDLGKNEDVKKESPKKAAKSKSSSNKGKLTAESEASTSKKNSKSKALSKSKTEDSNVSESFETLGLCSLDVFPLLQGCETIKEILLIHPTMEQTGSHSVSWTNLPTIEVTVKPVGYILNDLQEHFTNALFFTLESLCNISPNFTEHTQVSTVFPLDEEFEIIKFTDGTLLTDTGTWFSKRKKWNCLSSVRGQGGLSLYKLNEENNFKLKNTMGCHVTAKDVESVPRVQWLQLFRRHFSVESLRIFKEKLIAFRCWPIEVLVTKSIGKDVAHLDAKTGKAVSKETLEKVGRKEVKTENESNNHYVAFVDLSSLLYPGVTSTRVASQLFSYTEEAVKNQFGSELNMFGSPKPQNEPVSKSVKSGKDKKAKSTPSSPASRRNNKGGRDSELVREVY